MARVCAPWQPCRSIYVLVCVMFGLCECNSLSTWNCSDAALARPIRVIQCGTSGAKPLCPNASIAAGFGFYALDAHSGSYGGLFTIPAASAGGVLSQVAGICRKATGRRNEIVSDKETERERGRTSVERQRSIFGMKRQAEPLPRVFTCESRLTLLAYLQVDGCGLSRIDSFVYCVAGIGTSCGSKPKALVIRLGSAHQDASDASFEYVAVLPCDAVRPAVPWWSGSFDDASGAYHIITGRAPGLPAWLYVLDGEKRPDLLEGYAQHDAPGIADFSSMEMMAEVGHYQPYDLATKEVGGVTYGFFISPGGGASSYRVSPYEQKFLGNLQAKAGTTQTLTAAQKWGALWTYGNEVYAAASNGEGVWRLLLEDSDFDSPGPITVEYMGPSDAADTEFVDTITCTKAHSPYVPTACAENSAASGASAAVWSLSAACKCNAGFYALGVHGTGAVLQEASAATQGDSQMEAVYSAATQLRLGSPQVFGDVSSSVLSYSPSGGPTGKGHVSFDRGQSDYLDGGSLDLKIASNGGLTIVTVVRFTGSAGSYERIIDFSNGAGNENVILARHGSNNYLRLSILNGASWSLSVSASSETFSQNTWLTVIARYDASTQVGEVRVNGAVGGTATASEAIIDRTVSGTYVGKSYWSSDAYLNADMAGLLVVDNYLDLGTAEAIADSMKTNPSGGGPVTNLTSIGASAVTPYHLGALCL